MSRAVLALALLALVLGGLLLSPLLGARERATAAHPASAEPIEDSAPPRATATPRSEPRNPPSEPPPAPTLAAPVVAGPSAVVVRSVGELPGGVVAAVRGVAGVVGVAPVRAGAVLLTASRAADGAPVDVPAQGWGIPLDVIAVDPAEYAAVLPEAERSTVAALPPGGVLLCATSARVRGLSPGAVLEVGGVVLTVAGVIDDALVGSAELVVHAQDAARLGVGGVRYALVQVDGAVPGAVQVVEQVVAGTPGVLNRDLGAWPWPPSWREVLPQAQVKERFGEFAVRPGAGRTMAQESGWAEQHVVTATVPLLGEVRCHREVIGPLADALGELERTGLGNLVDPGDYAGCFSPRLIGAGAGPSRHAWGLAVDLNASRNPFGAPSTQDPRLVEVMERHGFGGRWPVPDAMHFEYRRL